jgi:hypothetical protein
MMMTIYSHDVEDPWARESAQGFQRLEPVHDDVTDAAGAVHAARPIDRYGRPHPHPRPGAPPPVRTRVEPAAGTRLWLQARDSAEFTPVDSDGTRG